jgi:hypothetical protein
MQDAEDAADGSIAGDRGNITRDITIGKVFHRAAFGISLVELTAVEQDRNNVFRVWTEYLYGLSDTLGLTGRRRYSGWGMFA